MPAMNDQLANDRTFLAWLRTGIALFGLGFVVAKIALFVDENAGGLRSRDLYTSVGCVMVVCGAALIIVGYVQHRKVAHILASAGEDKLPLSRWPAIVTIVAVVGAVFLTVLIAASS